MKNAPINVVPVKPGALNDVKVGDLVTRFLGGTVPMIMTVVEVTDTLITCGTAELMDGGWTFDKATGAEIDDGLGWGPPPKATGSYIVVSAASPSREQ